MAWQRLVLSSVATGSSPFRAHSVSRDYSLGHAEYWRSHNSTIVNCAIVNLGNGGLGNEIKRLYESEGRLRCPR